MTITKQAVEKNISKVEIVQKTKKQCDWFLNKLSTMQKDINVLSNCKLSCMKDKNQGNDC